MAFPIINYHLIRAVLLAPLSVVVFVAVTALIDVDFSDRSSVLRNYGQLVYFGSLIYLTIAYVSVLLIGVPVHLALRRRGYSTYTDYALFGIGGGVLLGIVFGGVQMHFLLVYGVICGWLVASVFWLLVRGEDQIGKPPESLRG